MSPAAEVADALRKLISTSGRRYDLIFADTNDTALGIIDDVYSSNLKDDVIEEIQRWRAESNVDQAGPETFLRIGTHGDEPDANGTDDGQATFGDFD